LRGGEKTRGIARALHAQKLIKMPTPIRSYHVTKGGDIKVFDYTRQKGEQDISKEYQNIAENKKNRLITATLDVEVHEGRTYYRIGVNGTGKEAALDAQLLNELFHEDLNMKDSSERSFNYTGA
jgi:hypothetical protein